MPGNFSDEARCSLFIKSGGKTGEFCFGRGRFRQTARQFFGLPITCRLVSARNYYAGRLFAAMLHTDCQTVPLPAHWQITSKLQLYALFLGNTAKVPLKGRALNYRAAVGAGTHNLVLKISKQLNRRGRFALGKLLFYCTAAAADARRAVRGMFI